MQLDVAVLIPLILGLGGGAGVAALLQVRAQNRAVRANADAVDAKTPAEVESVQVATMAAALQSAQSQVEATNRQLEHEREISAAKDAKLREMERVVSDLRARVQELTDELTRIAAELASYNADQ